MAKMIFKNRMHARARFKRGIRVMNAIRSRYADRLFVTKQLNPGIDEFWDRKIDAAYRRSKSEGEKMEEMAMRSPVYRKTQTVEVKEVAQAFSKSVGHAMERITKSAKQND